jgi:hypothetical protein
MSVPTDEALRVLAHHVGERLRQGRDHLVTAESCTGGWIAKCVTDIAGSSDWFDCGMAAYSYEAKQALLGVRPQTLEVHGAVSRETVIEMVSGALVNSGQAGGHGVDRLEAAWRLRARGAVPVRRRSRSGTAADGGSRTERAGVAVSGAPRRGADA